MSEIKVKRTFSNKINAPVHTLKTTKSWFEWPSLSITVLPDYSPEIKAIVNIWGHIKAKLVERKFWNNDQLWEDLNRTTLMWHTVTTCPNIFLMKTKENLFYIKMY